MVLTAKSPLPAHISLRSMSATLSRKRERGKSVRGAARAQTSLAPRERCLIHNEGESERPSTRPHLSHSESPSNKILSCHEPFTRLMRLTCREGGAVAPPRFRHAGRVVCIRVVGI